AVARCSSDHGAEATLRLLAGTALLLLHPWGRTARRLPAAELLDAIRTHVAAVEPEHPTLATKIIGFTPDPIPATDRTFLLSLVSWAGRSRAPIISTDSSSAALLLDQLRRLWFEGCRPDSRRFIDTVEFDIRSLAKDTATRSSTSAHGLNRLLLTIASIRRGEVLLDPACGQGSLFIDAHELLHGGGRVRQKVGFVGREQDLGTWTVAKVRLGLRGIAHDLGEPTDGTRCELTMPSFTHIVADPEVGARGLKVWTRRIVDLLDEHGTGQLVVPASLVFPTADGRGRGAWWKALQPHIDAVVFTPTDAAIILLRRDVNRLKLLVQIHRMTAAQTLRRFEEKHPGVEVPLDVYDPALVPFMPAQLRRVADLVSMSRGPAERIDEPTEEFIDCRSIAAITLEGLGAPRWGDCEAIRAIDFETAQDKEARLARERAAALVEAPIIGNAMPSSEDEDVPIESSDPRERARRERLRGEMTRRIYATKPRRTPPPSRNEADAVLARAIRAVELLRWLTDRSAADLRPKPEDPELAGLLEQDTTEEVRRALRRLELRLKGEETRGRRPSSGG
ncbi:MAG: N-6 DNA methylase, partial [Acidobacteria bacterium]|nr:N-6 DNA methylase [Acidobacteriota bacterium]